MEQHNYLINKEPTNPSSVQKRLLCIFQTRGDYVDSKYCLAILGSIQELGQWDRLYPVVAANQLDEEGGEVWRSYVELPVSLNIEYKWIVYDKIQHSIISYEPGHNRTICIGNNSLLVEDFEDGGQRLTEMTPVELSRLVTSSPLRFTTAENSDKPGPSKRNKASHYMEREIASVDGKQAVQDQNDVDNTDIIDVSGSSKVGILEGLTGLISRNKECIMKVGLFAGVVAFAVLLYKLF